MLRLIGFVATFAVAVAGFITVDYYRAKRAAEAEGIAVPALPDYLRGMTDRITALAGASGSATGLPTELAQMLPRPPEGWTVRPTVEEDLSAFLPERRGSVPDEAMAYVEAVVQPEGEAETIALTYERGERRVIFQAVRHPDETFSSAGSPDERFALRTRGAAFAATQFMTVRGLVVTEDILPEEVRARYFLASVGGQLHLRVLAPKRMRDNDLLPFFETLHVAAMNASVVGPEDGLGEVPVIVLASALDEGTRADYEAGVARMMAARAAEAEAELKAAEARATVAAAAEDSSPGLFSGLFGGGDNAEPEPVAEAATVMECAAGAGGIKRCKSVPAAPAAD